MATYVITTANYNSPAFWASITTSGPHTLDFSALPSTYSVNLDSTTNQIEIDDGTSVYVVGENGNATANTTLQAGVTYEDFQTVLLNDGSGEADGTQSSDTLTGGASGDTLSGDAGTDTIYGGGGDDVIDGGNNTDILFGGVGADTIVDTGGSLSDDTIFGGFGNDSIAAGDREDWVYGGRGDDTISGQDGTDTLEGGEGSDSISGGNDADVIHGDFADPGASYYVTEFGELYLFEPSTGDATLLQTGLIATGDIATTPDGSIYGIVFNELDGTDAGVYLIDPEAGTETLVIDLTDGSESHASLASDSAGNLYLNDDSTGALTFYESNGAGGFLAGVSAGTIVTFSTDIVFVDDTTAWATSNGNIYQYDVSATGVFSNETNLGTVSGGTDIYGLSLGADGLIYAFEGSGEVWSTNPSSLPLSWSAESSVNIGADEVWGVANAAGTVGGDDILEAGAGADTLYGGAGSDTLDNFEGAATLYGGDDDDTFVLWNTGGGSFNGVSIVGGEGGADNDTLDLSNLGTGITVTLTSGEDGIFTDGVNTGSFQDIETFVLTEQDDEFSSNGVTDQESVFGLGGNDSIVTQGGADFIDGGTGADSIIAGQGDDSILGGEGNDYIDGQSQNDTIDGGIGVDTILGGQGDDSILGGDGDDSIDGQTENDTIDGGAGADSIAGDTGNDSILGGADNDTISGGSGLDSIDGGTGADSIQGNAGDDTISGGDNDDTISGGSGDDLIYGGSGNDSLAAGNNTGSGDELYGGTGDDTLTDSFFNATLDGGDGADVFELGLGTATVFGGEGGTDFDTLSFADANDAVDLTVTGNEAGSYSDNDGDSGVFSEIEAFELTSNADTLDGSGATSDISVDAGAGNDTISGGTGTDTILGGDNADTIDGGAANDSIDGGAGADSISGGTGDDTVSGGDGNDILQGDTSAGIHVFGAFSEGTLLTGADTSIGLGDTFTVPTDRDVVFTVSDDDAALSGDNTVSEVSDDATQAGNVQYADGTVIATNETIYYESIHVVTDGASTYLVVEIEGQSGDLDPNDPDGDDIFAFVGNQPPAGASLSVTATYQDFASVPPADALAAGVDTSAGSPLYEQLSPTPDALPDFEPGDDTLTGGAGDDTFLYSPGEGNDTITDFNTGNTGALNDGNSTNNDFIDLSGYYDHLSELWADQADDGVLNQSNQGVNGVDYSDNTSFGSGSLTFAGAVADNSFFTDENTGVVCFAQGTLIATPAGDVRIETLKPGDKVLTRDNGPQELLWVGGRAIGAAELDAAPNLKPVQIGPALTGGAAPLVVSPQHGVLLNLDGSETLIRATHLARMKGGQARVMRGCRSVVYLHLLFERHEIIFANGVPSESLFLGSSGLATMTAASQREIAALFPEMTNGSTARPMSRFGELPPRLEYLQSA